MMGRIFRIIVLLIVATASFVVGVYVGPTEQGQRLRAFLTAKITSLLSEAPRQGEEAKTGAGDAAKPAAPAASEPEPPVVAPTPENPEK
jgi:hypothetical protein